MYDDWNQKWRDHLKSHRLSLLFILPEHVIHFLENFKIINSSIYYENRTIPCQIYELIISYQNKTYTFWRFEHYFQGYRTFSSWINCITIKHEPTFVKQEKLSKLFSIDEKQNEAIQTLFNEFPFLKMMKDIKK